MDCEYDLHFTNGTSNRNGVCIAIPHRLEKSILDIKGDNDGLYLLLQLKLKDTVYTLVNVYFPTKEKPAEQIAKINKLETLLIDYRDTKLIIGGDFHIESNPELDKWIADNKERQTKAALKLTEFKPIFYVIDGWRIMNSTLKRYTWRKLNPLQQSRLDFWLINYSMFYNVKNCTIEYSFYSHHNAVKIIMKITKKVLHGKGTSSVGR